MLIARKYVHLILAAIVVATTSQSLPAKSPAATGNATQAQSASTLIFNGTRYAHRWSKGTQNEFTPVGQEDLSKWQDMITLVPRQDAQDSATLAALAEASLAQYKGAGNILKTESTPRTENKPTEYLLVAILPGKGFLETVFVRIKLIEGTGVMAIYAHRNYGETAKEDFGAWIKANGTAVEQALMSWNGIPAAASLNALPQSP
ncbi:hypothetical protein [Lysobacter sp. CA199]|uniref:hypothetical protein n=1 Tax=Lysobacter sp. CA199 TaxID=3455608 RepID=UPI003F8CFB8C